FILQFLASIFISVYNLILLYIFFIYQNVTHMDLLLFIYTSRVKQIYILHEIKYSTNKIYTMRKMLDEPKKSFFIVYPCAWGTNLNCKVARKRLVFELIIRSCCSGYSYRSRARNHRISSVSD